MFYEKVRRLCFHFVSKNTNLVLEDTFTGMTADDLAAMMNGVDLEDPNQLSVAKGALDAVIGKLIIELIIYILLCLYQ